MAEKKFIYKVASGTEAFHFLPQPSDYGVLSYLASTGHEFLKKNYFVRRKDLDVYMINYTVNGEGVIVYGEKSYRLKKGDLCIIHLATENVFYPLTENYEIYFFHLKGKQVKEYYQSITANETHVVENFPEEKIISAFSAIREQLKGDTSYFELSKICNALLTDVLERAVKAPNEGYPPFINKILLKTRDGANMSVNDVAKQLGFSPIYLERVFKKHTGESIKSVILRRNIERAQNLLITTDMSVADIADAIGYADTNGLITAFKKYTGLTPLSYRKQNKR